MLDAISDFWKPSKKTEAESALDVSQLQIGASIGFGFIPQTLLSGKRATIKSINTYEFSGDRLTSYVLDVDGDTSVSMILADGQGRKYIALSRRIPFAERVRMLDNNELLACMDNAEQKRFEAKNPEGEWRNWLADQYKKAVHGLKGKIIEGDYRSISMPPPASVTKEFTYTLMISNNNEFALEVEQYGDNRIDVYATVYRLLTDIGEIKPPSDNAQVEKQALPSQRSASGIAGTARELAALKPANDIKTESAPPVLKPEDAPRAPHLVSDQPLPEKKSGPVIESGKAASKPLVLDSLKDLKALMTPAVEAASEIEVPPKDLPEFEPAKAVVPTIQTLNQPAAALPKTVQKPTALEVRAWRASEKADAIDVTASQLVDAVFKQAIKKPVSTPAPLSTTTSTSTPTSTPTSTTSTTPTSTQKESGIMATYNANFNTKTESLPQAEVRAARAIPGQMQEIENDVVECELRAANRIIEEAIRNEMPMSQVVRRIIALPVAQQEQVQIPVLLTDSDYHLLAIRYGIPAADRAAIKARIVEEINDFSGSNR